MLQPLPKYTSIRNLRDPTYAKLAVMLSYGAYRQVITCLEGDLPKQEIYT